MGARLSRRRILLLDLDNTLYDWVRFFAPAMRGMCRRMSEMTGIPLPTLFDEFKAVFITHGTVEYTFALQELPSLVALHPGETGAQIADRYRPAIEVFQRRRRAYLRPYPGVRQGIETLRSVGYEIYGVTDSQRFQAENRLRQLRLDRVLDGLCCRADHAIPDVDTVAALRRMPANHYSSELRAVIVLPSGLRKPTPGVLDFVVSALNADYSSCLYVGDSLVKDVLMAQLGGIYDCWAAYGSRVSPLDFATVVRVSDWSKRAVREALNPSPDRLKIFPSVIADSFESVVELALLDPADRPPRHVGRLAPRQLSLLEIGPQLTSG